MLDATRDWLQELVVQAVRVDVGAVGPKLIGPKGTVQSIGLSIDSNGIKRLYHGLPARHPGDTYRAIVAQNVSALPVDCLVMRKAIFEEMGGFDEVHHPRALFEIDMCLKLREKGQRIVCTPRSTITVACELEEEDGRSLVELRMRHPQQFERDPFSNPHLLRQGTPANLMQRSG
jgi:GT2 family glycosyltransferase